MQRLLEEKADLDSEIEKLYATFDAQLDLNDQEPEEEVGGTDDTMHAPERVDGEGRQLGADASAAADADEPPGPRPPGEQGPLPRAHAEIPAYDLHGFSVLTLVHDSGVHGLGVNFCRCEGHPPEHEQLLIHGLFPASTKNPQTAYDTGSIEKALLEESECHTPTESYWKKVTRLTVPEDPTATVVCSIYNLIWYRTHF